MVPLLLLWLFWLLLHNRQGDYAQLFTTSAMAQNIPGAVGGAQGGLVGPGIGGTWNQGNPNAPPSYSPSSPPTTSTPGELLKRAIDALRGML
jgi:hypothetical protein